jgi:alkylation response protein AidB-like acyl-CoA dehydrogenase
VGGLPAQHLLNRHLNSLSISIAAGTSQIQKNIIGERILGQAKDPAPAKA